MNESNTHHFTIFYLDYSTFLFYVKERDLVFDFHSNGARHRQDGELCSNS